MISFLGLFFLVVMASHTFRESVSGGTAASLPADQIHRYTDRDDHVQGVRVRGAQQPLYQLIRYTDIQIERI
jgi:hypothetical protein